MVNDSSEGVSAAEYRTTGAEFITASEYLEISVVALRTRNNFLMAEVDGICYLAIAPAGGEVGFYDLKLLLPVAAQNRQDLIGGGFLSVNYGVDGRPTNAAISGTSTPGRAYNPAVLRRHREALQTALGFSHLYIHDSGRRHILAEKD